MARHHDRAPQELPACYALVHPGLETVAADEIVRDLGGEIKKTSRGVIVFRVPVIDEDLLKLRTVEDVFLLAWGTDALTYRAADLKQIRAWTAQYKRWPQLFEIHRAMRPKIKGKPTYHLVAQMQGKHVYMRADAGKAISRGLDEKIPPTFERVDEDAYLEIWLTIRGSMGICGVRLSDRSMRHRTYKSEHMPASLRPTLAAAMVRLADAHHGQIVLDPMCGAGTILAEQIAMSKAKRTGFISVWGGDIEQEAIRAAYANLQSVGPTNFTRWDATRLPIASESIDRIVSNPPFGRQLSTPEAIVPLYREMIREADRVLKPGGKAVYLVSEMEVLRDAIHPTTWQATRQMKVQVLGQPAMLGVWQKPLASGTVIESE